MNTINKMFILTIIAVITMASIIALDIIPVNAQRAVAVIPTRQPFIFCEPIPALVQSFRLEINGCPFERIYVEDWDTLSDAQRLSITNAMLAQGWQLEPAN